MLSQFVKKHGRTTWKCPSCLAIKPLGEFYDDAHKKGGVVKRCKSCVRKTINRLRHARPAVNDPDRYYRTQEQLLESKRKSRASLYKTSVQHITQLESRVNCDICDEQIKHYNGSGKSACIDHCHDTGTIRGVLCGPCNRMLGLARDNPLILRSAANYLLTPLDQGLSK